MSIKIQMPALSPTMTEGNLTKWLVKLGDQVKAGDILAEIETDKATMEVEAVDEGFVTDLLFKEGDQSIKVNTVIAVLDGNAKDSKEKKIIIETSETNIESENVNLSTNNKLVKNNNLKKNDDSIDLINIEKNLNSKIFASPYVRRLANKEGIKLKNVSGSGPDGRIIKRDLDNKNIKPQNKPEIINNILNPSSMRKIIAERTTITKQTTPHFYLTIESNVDKLLALRKKINTSSNTKISINDILVKALAQSQKMNPLTNVSWLDGKIIQYNTINVSIAVSLTDGLITPIVKNADKKGLQEISLEIKNLTEKARKGKLLPDEYNGGTISISNLGMFGISEFSAIINPPQSSILAVGAIKKIPVVLGDEIKPANILKSTLSADHRVLDGVVAGKLLKDFNDIIENPFSLWLISDDSEII